MAALQPLTGPATTPTSTASATTATAPTARTSASATSTTTRSSRSSSRSTTTRSTPSTTTAPRSWRRSGSPTAQTDYLGARLGWGQFIRWLDPTVEDDQYHRHTGAWPDVRKTPWLQWTASPPSVADLDGDGRNEVIGLPERREEEPYETQGYAFMVLDGAQAAARARRAGTAASTKLPLSRQAGGARPDGDYYPPSGIPAPDRRRHRRRPRGPRSSPRSPTATSTRSARPAGASGATTTPTAGRRRSPPRSWPPTSTATARPSSSSAPTRSHPTLGPPRRALGRGQAALRHPPAPPGQRRQRHRRPRGAVDRRPRRRRHASRSCSRRSTTASTSSPCPARARTACRGRPAAATSCATALPESGTVASWPRSPTSRSRPATRRPSSSIDDLVVGEGDEATPGSQVEVHYVGDAWSTGEQFDASWDRGDPFRFALGAGPGDPRLGRGRGRA